MKKICLRMFIGSIILGCCLMATAYIVSGKGLIIQVYGQSYSLSEISRNWLDASFHKSESEIISESEIKESEKTDCYVDEIDFEKIHGVIVNAQGAYFEIRESEDGQYHMKVQYTSYDSYEYYIDENDMFHLETTSDEERRSDITQFIIVVEIPKESILENNTIIGNKQIMLNGNFMIANSHIKTSGHIMLSSCEIKNTTFYAKNEGIWSNMIHLDGKNKMSSVHGDIYAGIVHEEKEINLNASTDAGFVSVNNDPRTSSYVNETNSMHDLSIHTDYGNIKIQTNINK